MTLMNISMRSLALGKQTELNVLLPVGANKARPLKTLYALHGMSDDHTAWLRRSDIEVLAARYGVCVVMPNADLSFYVNMAAGGDYRTWVAEELPAALENMLPISALPEDRYITGISMGGYGAYYLALNYPERYAAAVSLSGPMRLDWVGRVFLDERLTELAVHGDSAAVRESAEWLMSEENIPEHLTTSLMGMASPRMIRMFRAIFGDSPELTCNEYDIFHMGKELAARLPGQSPEPRRGPALLAFCGDGDMHYESNLAFGKAAARLGLEYSLTTGEGGHDWTYWNPAISEMMGRLFGDAAVPSLRA